jgi:hypothetical protein
MRIDFQALDLSFFLISLYFACVAASFVWQMFRQTQPEKAF